MEDEIVKLKFNVDVALEKDKDGVYHPLDLKGGVMSPKKISDQAGIKYWELSMIMQGENMVKAGEVVEMPRKEAQAYLDAKVQRNGFKSKTFVTDPDDPRLYTEYPVAELAD